MAERDYLKAVNEHVVVFDGGMGATLEQFDLTLTRPTGTVPQVITTITARYEESPPKSEYTEATIRHDGTHFTIPVRPVV